MKYNLILENWKQFLQEADMASVAPTTTNNTDQQQTNVKTDKLSPAEEKENKIELHVDAIENEIKDVLYNAKKEGLTASDLKTKLISYLNQLQEAKKKRAKVVKKKSGDRCTRIAKRKYDVWPSAYASGAVVKCRQGKIWKGISENATDEEIDQELLLEEVEILEEEWSQKYKKSINCKNPKGFSQRAHCQGRKKKNEEIDLGEIEIIKEELDEAKKKDFC